MGGVGQELVKNWIRYTRANETMLGCQIKSFTGGGGGLNQLQTFPKFDFPTWGGGQGIKMFGRSSQILHFYGIPKRADQLSKKCRAPQSPPVQSRA